jgi:hypothetical protein
LRYTGKVGIKYGKRKSEIKENMIETGRNRNEVREK